MEKHKKTVLIIAITVFVIAAAYFAFLYLKSYMVHGRLEVKGTFRINHTDSSFTLDPANPLWDGIAGEKIHLLPQSARSPFGSAEFDILVRGAFNATEIAFLLEFPDDTENRTGPANPDACAVLVTPANASAVAQMMGYETRANIWHWLATRDAERYLNNNASVNPVRELTVKGPGTQTPMEAQYVDGRGEYKDGEWRVVFIRKREIRQKDEIDFEKELNIAFAVWNGSRMEASSRKSISVLRTLIMEKQAQ
ncbi:MAG: ethylbenzene dehydrogenase-related protein [Spirochaetota bacterium]